MTPIGKDELSNRLVELCSDLAVEAEYARAAYRNNSDAVSRLTRIAKVANRIITTANALKAASLEQRDSANV